jgi:hypothetical protein
MSRCPNANDMYRDIGIFESVQNAAPEDILAEREELTKKIEQIKV